METNINKKTVLFLYLRKSLVYPLIIYTVCWMISGFNLKYLYTIGLLLFISAFIAYGIKIAYIIGSNIKSITLNNEEVKIKYLKYLKDREITIPRKGFKIFFPKTITGIDYIEFHSENKLLLKQFKILFWKEQNKKKYMSWIRKEKIEYNHDSNR